MLGCKLERESFVMKMSIKTRLIAISLILVIVPAVFISCMCYFAFSRFIQSTIDKTLLTSMEESKKVVMNGLAVDLNTVNGVTDRVKNDIVSLSGSYIMNTYLSLLAGGSRMLDSSIQKSIENLVSGSAQNCKIQTILLEKKLMSDANLATEIVENAGGISFDEKTMTEWSAVNQLNGEKVNVSLPLMSVGKTPLLPNKLFSVETPVVDRVKKISGSFCTIFQRMDKEGDMMRAATNVPSKDGARAIGTFIPVKKQGRLA